MRNNSAQNRPDTHGSANCFTAVSVYRYMGTNAVLCRANLEVPTKLRGEYSIHNDGDVVSHGDLSKYSRCRHNGDNVNEDG